MPAELDRLELLRHDASLLGATARRVEALEGKKDDEPGQHREAGGEDAEHPGGLADPWLTAPLDEIR